MTERSAGVGDALVLEAVHFQALLDALALAGYRPVGPTLKDGHFVYDEISAVADLPVGLTDRQEGGAFRLMERPDKALFGYGVGQHSFKKFLFPPRQLLWEARRQGQGFEIVPTAAEVPAYAFIGIHACDLAALAVQDKVYIEGKYPDPTYRERRRRAFVVAVNCADLACGTCFCVSMGTGPKANSGFDLALTEVLAAGRHHFVVEVGTAAGAEMLRQVPHRPATAEEVGQAEALVSRTAGRMGRTLNTAGLKDLLYASYEHPRWDQVAARCLNCGNCTWVCPTCFCHTFEDTTDLTGTIAQRWRRLDVCFSVDFSYIHGGSIRATPRSRYRQWLTHKLATWHDQFGCSGCVGCGRCLTWCPVAIDITEEAAALRESPAP